MRKYEPHRHPCRLRMADRELCPTSFECRRHDGTGTPSALALHDIGATRRTTASRRGPPPRTRSRGIGRLQSRPPCHTPCRPSVRWRRTGAERGPAGTGRAEESRYRVFAYDSPSAPTSTSTGVGLSYHGDFGTGGLAIGNVRHRRAGHRSVALRRGGARGGARQRPRRVPPVPAGSLPPGGTRTSRRPSSAPAWKWRRSTSSRSSSPTSRRRDRTVPKTSRSSSGAHTTDEAGRGNGTRPRVVRSLPGARPVDDAPAGARRRTSSEWAWTTVRGRSPCGRRSRGSVLPRR